VLRLVRLVLGVGLGRLGLLGLGLLGGLGLGLGLLGLLRLLGGGGRSLGLGLRWRGLLGLRLGGLGGGGGIPLRAGAVVAGLTRRVVLEELPPRLVDAVAVLLVLLVQVLDQPLVGAEVVQGHGAILGVRHGAYASFVTVANRGPKSGRTKKEPAYRYQGH